jgi:hypothetical protein
MTTQTELFPKSHQEIADALLAYFEEEVEKRTKAMFSAQAKLAEALDLRKMAEQEMKRHAGKSVMETVADVVNSGALDTDGLTVTASVLPGVDPVTGEVAQTPVVGWECPACRGDGRIPDKTGGGHHGTCKTCHGTGHTEPSCDNCTRSCNLRQRAGSSTMGCGGSSWMHGEAMPAAAPYVSVVVVLYPGDDEPHVTKIGSRTRYSELVADYLAEAKMDGVIMEYCVRGEDDGDHRSLSAVIAGGDYGKRLVVERWDAVRPKVGEAQEPAA